MSDCQQLVYASRATFAPTRGASSIDIAVARILTVSRRNNPSRGLVGALYYSNGFFFQCLQGPGEALDTLCAQLSSDPRHRDIKILQRKPITAPTFSQWEMKYVPDAASIQNLLVRFGRKRFEPLTFDEPLTDAMVDLLRLGPDVSIALHSGNTANAKMRWVWAALAALAVVALIAVLI